MNSNFRKHLVGVAFKAILALFLVPGTTALLAHYFKQDSDTQYRESILQDISKQTDISSSDKASIEALIRSERPSETCFDDAPEHAQYRNVVCSGYSEMWQFVVVERTAWWTVAAGAGFLLLILALGAMAFARREIQYASFALGWRALTLFCAAEIIVQGAFLIWLSFWITAYFLHSYVIKLIAIVALIALASMFAAVVALFKRVEGGPEVQGELVPAEDAPEFWARIREFASRLGTAPPAHLVAGIDTNFFVIENPLVVSGKEIQGRTLFVSIPLLRVLDRDEADAVLAHELSHFAGGDTHNSAKLGPLLAKYDLYAAHMHAGLVTRIAASVLDFYRTIFEIALKRSSREREFAADRSASSLTSPKSIVHSLIKVSAYTAYRHKVQENIFSENAKQGETLDIASRIALGLGDFSRSTEFLGLMRDSNISHPFDSHPPLQERMSNVGYDLPEAQYASIVSAAPGSSWAESVDGDAQIEKNLWQRFEQAFSQAHEESLAYRYLPSNDEERELVMRYFPPVAFQLKKQKRVEVNYAGIVHPDNGRLIPWSSVGGLRFEEPAFRPNLLIVTHTDKATFGTSATKVPLRIERRERDKLGQALQKYWTRYQVAKAHATESEIGTAA